MAVCALSGSAEVAKGDHQDPHHLRRQESASQLHLVGGMASAISMQGDNAINMEQLDLVRDLIKQAIHVVENMYIPDLLAVASFYPEWTQTAADLETTWSTAICRRPGSATYRSSCFPRGAILNKNLSEVLPLDPSTWADPGGDRALLVQISGRQRLPCIRGTVSRS
jgi:Ni,Fe-hydrogenase I large subunit